MNSTNPDAGVKAGSAYYFYKIEMGLGEDFEKAGLAQIWRKRANRRCGTYHLLLSIIIELSLLLLLINTFLIVIDVEAWRKRRFPVRFHHERLSSKCSGLFSSRAKVHTFKIGLYDMLTKFLLGRTQIYAVMVS